MAGVTHTLLSMAIDKCVYITSRPKSDPPPLGSLSTPEDPNAPRWWTVWAFGHPMEPRGRVEVAEWQADAIKTLVTKLMSSYVETILSLGLDRGASAGVTRVCDDEAYVLWMASLHDEAEYGDEPLDLRPASDLTDHQLKLEQNMIDAGMLEQAEMEDGGRIHTSDVGDAALRRFLIETIGMSFNIEAPPVVFPPPPPVRPRERDAALVTLAAFARTAPGCLPARVRAAIYVAERDRETSVAGAENVMNAFYEGLPLGSGQ